MFRPMRLVLVVSLLLGTALGPPARGQAVIKGKPPSKGSNPAGADPKGSRAPVVVKTTKGVPLKVWEVDYEGPSYGKDENVVIGIDSIILYSDGRMRWWYYIHNKGEKNHNPNIVGTKLYVADARGETYRPIAWQYKPNDEGTFRVSSQGGTKERFWVDFPAPQKGTDSFKLQVPVTDFLWSGIAFKPFTVKLVEPISIDAGEAMPAEVVPEAKPEPAPMVAPKPTVNSDPAAEMARPKAAASHVDPATKDRLARAVRDVPEKGQRFEGTIHPKKGDKQDGGIRFDAMSSEEPFTACIYRKPGSPEGVMLTGGIVKDVTVPAGIKIQLLDSEKVKYWFTLDGSLLSGSDTLGRHYSFNVQP